MTTMEEEEIPTAGEIDREAIHHNAQNATAAGAMAVVGVADGPLGVGPVDGADHAPHHLVDEVVRDRTLRHVRPDGAEADREAVHHG